MRDASGDAGVLSKPYTLNPKLKPLNPKPETRNPKAPNRKPETRFGKKARCFAFHLDPERLAATKTAAALAGQVPYVTTNDILTSGFFNECGTRIGMMGLDCRGRLAGIDQDLAGNDVTALTLDPETFATLASVRKMLSSTPFQTTALPLPGCCGWFCGMETAK